MATKIKTGHVFQRTSKGPNYIALGKTKDANGKPLIIATKNGNIRLDGRAKLGHRVRRNAKAPLGKKGDRLALFAFRAENIHQIHGYRSVDLGSIWERGQAEDIGVEVKKMSASSGVKVTATSLI